MSGILILFHCESNPGYAASSHEHTFLEVAKTLTGDFSSIHFAYSTLEGGMTPSLSKELTNIIQLDTRWTAPDKMRSVEEYIRSHNIDRLLGFDQPVTRPMYQAIRKGGIKTFVSYWGAPMSSLNSGVKLLVKKLEVAARRNGPDHYIFQSSGMRDTAVNGRGIPRSKTSIVRTGIDTLKYSPDKGLKSYVYRCFNIPLNQRIVVFSGHMERRKGVHIVLEAAKILTQDLNYRNVHFLILGNRPGEKQAFTSYLKDPDVSKHVTFGGYRNDISDLLKGCALGMIASVEWDSFPMSSLEMAATELPLLVSDLPGLNEAVTPLTGAKFEINNPAAAAYELKRLLSEPATLSAMGQQGRMRVIKHYSLASQASGIVNVFRSLEDEKEQAL